MGAEVFDQYAREYESVSQTIEDLIRGDIATRSGEERKVAINDANRRLAEAKDIVKFMEKELNGLPVGPRNRLQPRFRSINSDCEKLGRDLNRAIAKPPASERDSLLGARTAASDVEVAYNDQRTRLLVNTERVNDSSKRIENIERVALESEAIGAGVLSDLEKQRGIIQGARDKLEDTNVTITRSNQTVSVMIKRAFTNKFIIAIIIIVFVGILALILFLKFGKNAF